MRPGIFALCFLLSSLNALAAGHARRPDELALCLRLKGSACVSQAIGELPSVLTEASGIAFSDVYDRMYAHNDSVEGVSTVPNLRFYVMRASSGQSQLLQTVEIRGFAGIDVEDVSYGACPDAVGRCLYFADTGSNGNWRDASNGFKVAVVREVENFPAVVDPLQVIHFRYPTPGVSGPANLNMANPSAAAGEPNFKPYWDTEAMSLDPSTGDLYFSTKAAENGKGAVVYRLPRERFSESENAAEYVTTLTFAGTAPCRLGELNATFAVNCYRTTAMDFSPDGARVLVLAYGVILEFDRTFSRAKSIALTDPDMPQAESIAYDPRDPSHFSYTTEVRSIPRLPGVSERPIRSLGVSELR